MSDKRRTFAVIDGNSLMHRAFHAVPPTMNAPDGRPTNAIFGFLNMFLKMIDAFNPDGVVVAFDKGKPRVRMEMLPQYKAQRPPMDPDLHAQFPMIKELLTALNVPILQSEGWEGDDILGTMARLGEEAGCDMLLVTGDRDMYQLVTEHVNVVSTRKGLSDVAIMTPESVDDLYHGITPALVPDFYGLKGDTSDNIPGVAGVGEKTALALIQDFGSLAGVYENIDDARIKKGVREKLLRDKEQAGMSRTLAEIVCSAPVNAAPGAYKKDAPDAPAAARLLTDLEMYATLDKLRLPAEAGPQQPGFDDAPAVPLVEAAPLPALTGPVYLCAAGDVMLAVQDGAVYSAGLEDEAFLALLANEAAEKRCFDAKPLYRACFAHGLAAQNITFDAKLAAYLLNPAASDYTVARLAAEYGVRPAFSAPWPEAGVLEELCAVLREKCDAEGMGKLLDDIEFPLCEVLASMEHIGILVDRNGIEAFGQELQTALGAELRAIYDEVGYEFNVNSPKQLGKALFEDLGLPTRKKTKSGYSTNAETLESLRDYSPVIGHILQYRTYQKLNSTYVEGLLKVVGADGRIHSTFNQTETRTGRISSGEPNLQNIPVRTELGSRFRKYFIAPQGETLLDADYSQIELRLLAHISGDEAMCEAFRSGADIHRSTAARIYGLPPEQVTPALRSSAKAVNFGIVYGIGAFSLSKDIGVSVKEADAFIKNYFANFPGVKKYLDETVEQGRENGYVTTLYGRRRTLPELASSNFNVRSLGERMAMNTPIQGTAADIIKLAMVRVYRRLKAEGLRARLILQVHDELIVECPAEEKERAAKVLGEEMRGAAELRVPLSADVNSGTTWYAAKG